MSDPNLGFGGGLSPGRAPGVEDPYAHGPSGNGSVATSIGSVGGTVNSGPDNPANAPASASNATITVATLQQALHDNGFDPGPIDGVWGPQTQAAVTAFQKAKGLAVDGIPGPQTLSALGQPTGGVQGVGSTPGASTPAPAPEAPAAPTGAPDVTSGPPPAPAAGGGGSVPFLDAVQAAGGVTPEGNIPGSDADITTKVKQQYGAYAYLLDDPELGPILRQAAKEGWDSARLEGKIETTTWWATHSAAQRQFDADSHLDPATQRAKIDSQAATIVDTARKMGIDITPDRAHQIASDGLRLGWGNTEFTDAIHAEFHYRPVRADNTPGNIPADMVGGKLIDRVTGKQAYYGPNGEPGGPTAFPGAAQYKQADGTIVYYTPNKMSYAPGTAAGNPIVSSDEAQLRAMAAEYMVPLSDQTMGDWVTKIVTGQVTPDQFRGYLTEQAKSMFPSLSAALDAGITVKQYVEPYRQLAAQTLEIAPDSIDFTQPQWQKALTQVDPKTGARTSMSLSDWQTELRSNPLYGYSQTQGAKTQAYDSVLNLTKSLGAIA